MVVDCQLEIDIDIPNPQIVETAEEIGVRAFHQSFVLQGSPSASDAEVFAFSEMTSSFCEVFPSCLCGFGRPEFASGHGIFASVSPVGFGSLEIKV